MQKRTPEIDALREKLQVAALLGLSRHQFFEHATFYGGTALRILHGLDRYSEDLDFSLLKKDLAFDFLPYLEGMHKEMKAFGYQLDINFQQNKKETQIKSAFLKGNTTILLLSLQKSIWGIHPEQKLQIKLEVDTDPPQTYLPLESKLILHPVPFYVSTYALPDLFAGKMHALLCRNWKERIKGRDWYDFIWYIQRKIPLHLPHLQERMLQSGHLRPQESLEKDEVIELLHQKIDKIDWKKAKEDIAPFVSHQKQLDIWSASFFHDLINYLLFH